MVQSGLHLGPFGGEGLRLLKHRLHEHLRHPTPSDISKNAPSLQGLSHAGVARSRCRRMISAVKPDPHQTFNNVTTPNRALHDHLFVLRVVTESVPRIKQSERLATIEVAPNFWRALWIH